MALQIPISVRDCVGCEYPDALISAGVPFKKGALKSDDFLSVQIDGKSVPCQTHVLSTWPDDSLKWVLVDYQADIPRQGQVDAILLVNNAPARRPQPKHKLAIKETKEELSIDNGVLSFKIQRQNFRLLENLIFKQHPIFHGIDGSARKPGQAKPAAANLLPLQKMEIEQSGPVKAVIRLRGTLSTTTDDSGRLLDFTARLTVAADAPWVRVEWCFINPGYDLTEEPDPKHKAKGLIQAGEMVDRTYTPLDLLRLDFDLSLPDCHTAMLGGDITHTFHYEVHPPATLLVPLKKGQAHLRQAPGKGGCRAWACAQGPDGHQWIDLKDKNCNYKIAPIPVHKQLPDGSETVNLVPPLAGWVHMSNGSAGFTVQIQHFYANRPTKIDLDTNRLTLDLWPAEEETLKYEEGMAKTHILTVSFFDTDMKTAHVDTVATARAQPVVPRLDPNYVQQTGAVGDIFPADPKRYPAIEMALRIGARHTRRSGDGMLNFGDEGKEPIFHQNQYDWQFACFLYYLRTGFESAFIDGEACTWHSMDVDTIHHHRDPLMFEGQHNGRANHTELPVDPHMLFCQGILTYYHLTGNPYALETACGIARNAIRQLRGSGMVFNNARAAGWSMLCVAAVYEETRDPELLRGLEEYFDGLERWQSKDGGFKRRVADGHNGYWLGSNAFMMGILLSSIYRAYEATGSERARNLFLKGVNHFMEKMTLPHGIIGITEGARGEKDFCVATSYSMQGQTQALAWASKLTGDPKYIQQAVRFWEFALRFDGELRHFSDIRMSWWALFRVLHIASEFGLLDRIETGQYKT